MLDDQLKDKKASDTWNMLIPEGMFEYWAYKTNTRLMDKGFETTTEDDTIKFIGTVYEHGLL